MILPQSDLPDHLFEAFLQVMAGLCIVLNGAFWLSFLSTFLFKKVFNIFVFSVAAVVSMFIEYYLSQAKGYEYFQYVFVMQAVALVYLLGSDCFVKKFARKEIECEEYEVSEKKPLTEEMAPINTGSSEMV